MADKLVILRNVMLAGILGIAVAACSDGEEMDNRLPEGKYPLTFTASGLAMPAAPATRATADGTWTGGEEVAVQVEDEGIKTYTATVNGQNAKEATLSVATGETPFYWQSSNETKLVSAWYCGDGSTASGEKNAGKVPASWSVQPDQDKGKGYQKSDFLYAVPKNIKFGDPEKSISFTHQTAHVVINIKNEEAATEADVISSVVIGYGNNLALSGTYSVPTEGNATGAWNISNGTMGTITPKDITAGDGGDILKTYAALVIPQNMSDKKFIAVTLADKNTYYYTPQDTDADLKSGTQYTYNITVKHGYLEVVTVKTDGVWGDGGTTDPVESKIPVQPFTADDLKIGDYYYSDGTTSDGGYRKYPDETTAILDIKPVLTNPNTGDERTCIGIVYWVGDPTKPLRGSTNQNLQGDETLANDHKDCTQGLVVSLDEEECIWQESNTSVQDWLNSHHSGEFLPVQSGTGASDPLNNIQGYNNTKAIEAFNAANSGSEVYVVQKVVEYRKKVSAPAASSGWYVPSAKELTLLCGTDVDNIYTNDFGTANRNLINEKLKLINATTLSSSSDYWSSTEYSNISAFHVYFYSGRVYYNTKNYYSFRVRFSFAF